MELVDDYYDPRWPFELWIRDEISAELVVTTPPPAEQPDWSRVVIVHDAMPQTICAVLREDRTDTAGWFWVEGSMRPIENIFDTIDDWLHRGACDWSYDETSGP